MDPICKRCGKAMQIVTDVMPRGGDPGLRAFMCETCSATNSVLVFAAKSALQRAGGTFPVRKRDK